MIATIYSADVQYKIQGDKDDSTPIIFCFDEPVLTNGGYNSHGKW